MNRTINIAACLIAALSVAMSSAAFAGQDKIKEIVRGTYPPAIQSKGLLTAQEELKPATLRGFAVIKRGGIPAERARFFIQMIEYDYRGVIVHLDDEGRLSTRVGRPYTYLQRGDLVAIADVKFFNRGVYLSLITPEVYVPGERSNERHFSRVTVMLGFKIPKDTWKADDADAVLKAIGEWLEPFRDVDDAKSFAAGLREADAAAMADAEGAEKVELEDKAAAVDENKIKMDVLEEKIERTRREMIDAEAEMKKLREEMKKEGKK